MDKDSIINDIKLIKKNSDELGLIEYVANNFKSFFTLPDIAEIYSHIKDINLSQIKNNKVSIIIAWMAFTSGDNLKVSKIINRLNVNELDNPQVSSLYYSLKAFLSGMVSNGETIKYSKLAIDILPLNEFSIYSANAFLTYGSVLSGHDNIREAAEFYRKAFEQFYKLEIEFLAMVSLTNELLCKFRLGEFTYVLDKCREELMMKSSFEKGGAGYWNVIGLPLGMCLYELNKPKQAIYYLELAAKTIDAAKLLHMHGLIEMYIFKSYYISNDLKEAQKVLEIAESIFGNLHSAQLDNMLFCFKVMMLNGEDELMKMISEGLQLSDIQKSNRIDYNQIDAKVIITLASVKELIYVDELTDILGKARYTGDISRTQITLIQIAQLLHLKGDGQLAADYLEQAYLLYKEYGIYAAFNSLNKYQQNIIDFMTPKMKKNVSAVLEKFPINDKKDMILNSLTKREKEILRLISIGMSNKEIGEKLFLSTGTVKWHINNIFVKLNASNRIQAVDFAKRSGEI